MPGSDIWSNGNNWINEGGTRYALNDPPQQASARADTLRFTNASVADSTDNINAATFARIEIANVYTGNLNLGADLTVNQGFINGGTIRGQFSLTIDSSTDFLWKGGTFSNSYVYTTNTTTLVVDPASLGATEVKIQDCTFTSEGTMRLNSGILHEARQSWLLNGANGHIYFLRGANAIVSDVDSTTLDPTSLLSNAGEITVTPTAGGAIDSFNITPLFSNILQGQITVPDRNRIFLNGGGTLQGSINLGGADATFGLNVLTETGQPFNKTYAYTLYNSFSGTGTFRITGTIVNSKYVDPDVTIGRNIALPTGISFVTHGGFINGPGTLTLNLRNTIQNTWIRNNGSIEVNPGARLTISQDASMYSRTERDSSRVDGGSTLLAAGGSTITIDNADLYIGANSTLKLDRTPGIPFPATIVLSGQGGAARSNILTLTGTTGGQIVSIGGLFSSNLTTAPIVGVFLDHTGGDFRSDATVDIFFRGGMRLRRVPGGAQMQGGGSTGIMAHQGSLEIAQDSYMSGAEELDQKLTNDGSLIPGDSGAGALLIPDGGFTQTGTGNLTMNLGPISDQIATQGPISLDGSLTLNAPTDFNPSVGTVIILIENQGTGPITGQFQGLNEKDLVAVNATEYTISYQGGDGNDVVLTAQAKVKFNAPANQTTLAGSSATLPLTASASNGHPLSFSHTGLPPGLSINSTTGVISGRIASSAGSATDYAVTVRATYAGGHASTSQSFHWTVHPPVITFANPGNQASYAGSTVSLMLAASVSNGDHLTFSQTGLPAGLTIDSATGRISGTIATSARSATPHVIRITVWDADAGISMTITFNWLVSKFRAGACFDSEFRRNGKRLTGKNRTPAGVLCQTRNGGKAVGSSSQVLILVWVVILMCFAKLSFLAGVPAQWLPTSGVIGRH